MIKTNERSTAVYEWSFYNTRTRQKFLLHKIHNARSSSFLFTFLSLHEILTYEELLLSVLASLHTIGIVLGRVSPDHVLHEPFDRQTTLDAILIGEPMPRTSCHNLTPERLLTGKIRQLECRCYHLHAAKLTGTYNLSSTNKWLC